MPCSTCQCEILEVRVVSGVQHMLACVTRIRSESGQCRAAPVSVRY